VVHCFSFIGDCELLSGAGGKRNWQWSDTAKKRLKEKDYREESLVVHFLKSVLTTEERGGEYREPLNLP
jgi:hypothetical protein